MESPRAIFETQLSVRPDDIDMHQHVHNSRYLDYVLAARLDQMERCYQMSMTAFFDRGLTWFVKTAHVDHHRALKMGDAMLVRTSVSKIGKREVTVIWEILRVRDEKLSAHGYCNYSLVNRESGRPQLIPEDVIAMYSV